MSRPGGPTIDVKRIDCEPLDRALRAALAGARTTWPNIRLGDADFLRHLARHLPEEGAVEKMHTNDLFLSAACAQGEPSAVEAFEREYLSRVPGMVARIERTPLVVDELVQSVRIALLTGEKPLIAQYSGRGPLHSWLRAVALNIALMGKRKKPREMPRASRDLSEKAMAGSFDAEAALLRKRYHGHFQEALSGALRSLAPRERNILRAYFVDEMTIDQLAVRFRVHRATAARRVQAARKQLLDETRRLVSKRVILTVSEFDSLARLVKSDLSLSFSNL